MDEEAISNVLKPKTPKKSSGGDSDFEFERSSSALDDGPTGVQYERYKWQGRHSRMAAGRPSSAMDSYRRPSSALAQSKPPQVNGWDESVNVKQGGVRSHSAMRQQVSFSPYVQSQSYQAQMEGQQAAAAQAQRPQSAMTYRTSKSSKKWKRHYGPQFEYTLDYSEEEGQGRKKQAQVKQSTFNRKTQSWTEYSKDTPRVTTPVSGGQFLHGEQKTESETESKTEQATEAAAAEPAQAAAGGQQWTAVYDYVASDDDELTFKDGDVIMNAQVIADGWMYGTLATTGQSGLLPSNYVQAAA